VLSSFNGNLRVGITYAVGDFLAIGTRYAPTIAYAFFLSAAEFGILAVTMVVYMVMGILVVFGLRGAAFKQSFEYADKEEKRSFYGSLWLFLVIAGALFTFLVDFFWSAYFPNIFTNVAYDPYIRLALWASYLNGFGIVIYEIYRAQSAPLPYVSLSFANAFTLAGLSIWFVGPLHQGVLGAVGALVFTGLIWAVIYSLAMLPHINLRLDLTKLRKALAYSLPLVPHFLAHWVLNLSDRIVLERTVSIGEVGVYSFGYNLGNLQQVFANSGNSTLMPQYGAAQQAHGKQRRLSGLFTKYIAVMAATTLAISIFSDEFLIAFIPQHYYFASAVVPWVALGFFSVSLYYGPMNTVTLLAGRTRWVWLFTLMAGVVNVGSNMVFVPRFGILAAAVNSLLGYLILFLLITWYSRGLGGPPYEWKRIGLISAALVVAIIADRSWAPASLGLETLVDALLVFVFLFVFLGREWSARPKRAG